jgi:hypothetical protein
LTLSQRIGIGAVVESQQQLSMPEPPDFPEPPALLEPQGPPPSDEPIVSGLESLDPGPREPASPEPEVPKAAPVEQQQQQEEFIFDDMRICGRRVNLCISRDKGFVTATTDDFMVRDVFVCFEAEFDEKFPQWRQQMDKAVKAACQIAGQRMHARIEGAMEARRKRWRR